VDSRAPYREVAELHIACIDQGFLATLGVSFLSLMYEAIDKSAEGVLFVAEDNGTIVGFIAGSSGTAAIYRRMLRNWLRLSIALLPALFSWHRIWRIWEILRYTRRSSAVVALPKAELLSLAITPKFRGQKQAEMLYHRLEDQFRANGVPAFKIVVGQNLTAAHSFYRRVGAEPVCEVEVHGGETSTVYVQAVKVGSGRLEPQQQ